MKPELRNKKVEKKPPSTSERGVTAKKTEAINNKTISINTKMMFALEIQINDFK
jgi:hypothetical protein